MTWYPHNAVALSIRTTKSFVRRTPIAPSVTQTYYVQASLPLPSKIARDCVTGAPNSIDRSQKLRLSWSIKQATPDPGDNSRRTYKHRLGNGAELHLYVGAVSRLCNHGALHGLEVRRKERSSLFGGSRLTQMTRTPLRRAASKTRFQAGTF